MQFGDILVCIDGSPTGRKRTEIALALAARSGARVVGYALQSPSLNADEAELEFERDMETSGLEGIWVLGRGSHQVEDIAHYARCADLVVLGLGIPDDPSSDPQHLDVEQVVVECGRPVLGIPVANVPEEIGKTIMVAWDGSRESTRALHDAVPFLREAATVRIASIGSDLPAAWSPAVVKGHLERLGITAEVDTELDLQLPIGEEILSRVEREDVDLLVAGAFGHSRLREHLFGGASQTLLHQMMVPVLVSH